MGLDWLINPIIRFPTLVLAVVSVFCNIFIIIDSRKAKRNLVFARGTNGPKTHEFLTYQLFYIMAIIDVFAAIGTAVTFGLDWEHEPSYSCPIVGCLTQFLSVSSALWKLLIPSYLLHLLAKNVTKRSSIFMVQSPDVKNSILGKIIFVVLTLGLISAISPILADLNDVYYGVFYSYTKDNNEEYGAECWATGYFDYVYESILAFSVLFEILVLLYGVIRYNYINSRMKNNITTNNNNNNNNNNHTAHGGKGYMHSYSVLLKRLFAWTVVFTIVRVVPVTDEILSLAINGFKTPLWLVLTRNYCIGCTGIANRIAWDCDRRIKLNSSHGKKKKDKDKDKDNYKERGYSRLDQNDDKINPMLLKLNNRESSELTSMVIPSSMSKSHHYGSHSPLPSTQLELAAFVSNSANKKHTLV